MLRGRDGLGDLRGLLKTGDREGVKGTEVAEFDACLLTWVSLRVADFAYYCLKAISRVQQRLTVW